MTDNIQTLPGFTKHENEKNCRHSTPKWLNAVKNKKKEILVLAFSFVFIGSMSMLVFYLYGVGQFGRGSRNMELIDFREFPTAPPAKF